MKEVKREKVINSNLFPDCIDCDAARNHGDDEIIRTLSPSVENPDPIPSNPSTAIATVECELVAGQMIASTEVEVDGEPNSRSTGPIDCPALKDSNN